MRCTLDCAGMCMAMPSSRLQKHKSHHLLVAFVLFVLPVAIWCKKTAFIGIHTR